MVLFQSGSDVFGSINCFTARGLRVLFGLFSAEDVWALVRFQLLFLLLRFHQNTAILERLRIYESERRLVLRYPPLRLRNLRLLREYRAENRWFIICNRANDNHIILFLFASFLAFSHELKLNGLFVKVGVDLLILLCTYPVILALGAARSASNRLHFDLQDLLIGLRRAVAAVDRVVKGIGRSGLRLVVADFFGQHGLLPTLLHRLVALLQVANELDNAFFRLLSGLLPLVPVWNLAAEVNSLDLLDEGSNDVILFVAQGPHGDQVQINPANHVFASHPRMLISKPLITLPRDDKLVLAWLLAVDVVVRVEEGSVVEHEGHLVLLVHYLEVTVPLQVL